MKAFLALVICISAVSALKSPLLEVKNADDASLKECLTKHNISPDVLGMNGDEKTEKFDKLSGEQQGCVAACIYRNIDVLKSEGNIDYEQLILGDKPEEIEEEKKNYQRIIDECKTEVGTEDCKFAECFMKKEF